MKKRFTEDPKEETQSRNQSIRVPLTEEEKMMVDTLAAEDAGDLSNINIAFYMRKLIYQAWQTHEAVKRVEAAMKAKGQTLRRKTDIS